MIKNIIIGFLIVCVFGLSGYVIWSNRNTASELSQQTEQANKNTEQQQAAQETVSAKHFVYGKITSPQITGLYLSDADGNTKLLETARGYQFMGSGGGESLAVKFTRGDEYTSTNNPMGYHYTLESITSDGTIRSLLEANPEKNIRSVVFSPDGSKIAYVLEQNIGYTTYIDDLYTMNNDGSNQKLVAADFSKGLKSGNHYVLLGWGSDNKAYLTKGTEVQEGTQEPGLWALDLASGVITKADSSSEIFGGATMSPDGTKITYVPFVSTSPVKEWVPASPKTTKVFDILNGTKTTLTEAPASPSWVIDFAKGKFAADIVTQNSTDTNADDVHQLEIVDGGGVMQKVVDSFTGPGSFQFGGSL